MTLPSSSLMTYPQPPFLSSSLKAPSTLIFNFPAWGRCHFLILLRLLHLCISHPALRSDHTHASRSVAPATTRARSRARRLAPDRTFTPRLGAAAASRALATASAPLASPPAAGPQLEQRTAYVSVTSVSLLRVLCSAPVTARAAFLRGIAATEGHGSACAALGWLRLRPLAAGLG